jgi:hypothetical protein
MRSYCQRLGLPVFTGMLALAFALALSAAASAAIIRVGELGKVARISYPEPVDTAFWLTGGKGGTPAPMPQAGLVRVIRLRGCASPAPNGQSPLTQVHFQTLVPGPGNTVTVKLTSGPFNVPVCGSGASASTVTAFRPEDLCAGRGDYVDFNDEGGYGPGFPNGVPYAVFGAAAGAATDSFTSGGATNNGDKLTGTVHAGVRLLMQVVLGTGHNAGSCG